VGAEEITMGRVGYNPGITRVAEQNPASSRGKEIAAFSGEQWVIPAGGTLTKTSGTIYEVEEADAFEIYAGASAVSGATPPSLVFTPEVSPDGGANWYPLAALTAINSITNLVPVHITGRHPLLRIKGVATGDNADTITANVSISLIPKG
jgi:hypothetical protein